LIIWLSLVEVGEVLQLRQSQMVAVAVAVALELEQD
jgi:hypothetical protein